jgi:carboxymethylenebutenolidase
VTFLASIRRALGAGVGFYGGGIVNARFPQFPALIDESSALQTPWLGLFGDEDQSIPVEDVERLRGTLGDSAPVEHDVVRFAGAQHGFNCDERPSYHPQAAGSAWRQMLDWFGSHLG